MTFDEAKAAEMDRLREEMTIKLCSGDPTDQADAYTALQEIIGSDPRNDPQATQSVYDPIAWKTYSRDAACRCTAPDPADCSLSHGTGAWLCVCHRLSEVTIGG
ncbi:hypothetical protein [Streptomyces sp. NEAU-174]|uniref:hypothetical protein n=1 Tax=Streptomyces sp. NEAU-174 TaxID=3458254 RepID=UPI004044FD4F